MRRTRGFGRRKAEKRRPVLGCTMAYWPACGQRGIAAVGTDVECVFDGFVAECVAELGVTIAAEVATCATVDAALGDATVQSVAGWVSGGVWVRSVSCHCREANCQGYQRMAVGWRGFGTTLFPKHCTGSNPRSDRRNLMGRKQPKKKSSLKPIVLNLTVTLLIHGGPIKTTVFDS